ncbi:twin-arginine translocation signal domain-containing protein [Laribacter hongkongensis]|uniref:twin-arginine translocation signal domain-containing protein n=1 Tax=Laribacter hongkongensis TaxID=168471 RepID=UPI001EFEDC58|nr:twin-arginine translocation signal domain-containing protein [Laribacter hongkongensis]MCG8996222.1 twin-arginine translocation signal domain-containing protein [Laribacter hongkongensis]MCG9009634.1 twin-arginine translocation signal domain-containing protein [Laribacter hongkongensis]MCG9023513.1 twin-arginine translocation signal domain-containing protein [Laribacter hongkongensis]MCG9048002.1 twin-arginine translocation signal domain-containing protein [Laribacter hongkongensis]MCG90730
MTVMTRRQLLKAGAAGGAALVLAGWWAQSSAGRPAACAPGESCLSPADRTVVLALAPALVGRWPADDPEAGQTLLAGLDTAISSLPAPMQQEIGELFAFLSFPPVRWLYLRLPAWDQVRPDAAAQALARLQGSPLPLVRSVYCGLHKLVLAAWYGNPAHWAATGYEGPPAVVLAARQGE